MKGRKPKPSALRILEGTDARADRPINAREPTPKTELPKPPAHLSKEARKHWRRLGKQLLDCGVLSTLDAVALEGLSNLYVRYVKAQGEVDRLGAVRLIPVQGGTLPEPWHNPYRAEVDRVWKQIQSLLSEFGMTPSSRTRIQVDKPADRNSIAAFAAKKQQGAS